MGRQHTRKVSLRRVSLHRRRKYTRGGNKLKLLKRLFTPSRWFTRKNKIVADNKEPVDDDILSLDDINLDDKLTLDIPPHDPYENTIDSMDSVYDLDNRNNMFPDKRSIQEMKKEQIENGANRRKEEWTNNGGKRCIRKTRKIKHRN